MTFQTSYAKLLTDPDFGTIKKRREHAKQMYHAGLRHALVQSYVAEGKFLSHSSFPVSTLLEEIIDKEIAEESK